MRILSMVATSIAIVSFGVNFAVAADVRTCSANSADKKQSCSVTCPEGKTATCTGGNTEGKDPSDVNCTCK